MQYITYTLGGQVATRWPLPKPNRNPCQISSYAAARTTAEPAAACRRSIACDNRSSCADGQVVAKWPTNLPAQDDLHTRSRLVINNGHRERNSLYDNEIWSPKGSPGFDSRPFSAPLQVAKSVLASTMLNSYARG